MVSIERRDLMKSLVATAVASTLRSAQAAEPPVFGGIMRKGRPPGDSPSKPPAPVHSVERADGLLIERNAAVKLRDGVTIYADVYRPDGPLSEEKLPAIVGWGPYGKHTVGRTYSPESGVKPAWISKYTGFEGNDPLYWCPRGYAIVYPDPRGLWWSEGDMHHGGIIESQDCYDLIEWVGTRDW